MSTVSDVPPSLRGVAHYVKIANENASRDVVIYYWGLYYAVQHGMTLDKSSPEAVQFLGHLLSTLEKIKKDNPGNDALTQDVVAQSYIESYALKLFNFADKKDREGNYGKNVVKAFYTAGHLFDILGTFGELDENIQSAKKYAKWKATYINNCLKNGETPIPGPPNNEELGDFNLGNTVSSDSSVGFTSQVFQDMNLQPTSNNYPPAPHFQQPNSFPTQPTNVYPQPPPRTYPTPEPSTSIQPTTTFPAASNIPPSTSMTSGPAASLTLDDFMEARKLVKYALSALDYEDAKTAIDNMNKAMKILQKN